jgi:peptide/nickel transport system permease protein
MAAKNKWDVVSRSPHIPWGMLAAAAVAVGLWGAASRLIPQSNLYLPSPAAVGAALLELSAKGILPDYMTESLRRVVLATSIGLVIGVPLGILAGLAGGWLGEVIMRITDIFLAVPGLILAIAIVASLGPGITNAMIALSLVWWPGYVRLVQGKTLSLKTESFIETARCVGSSRWRAAGSARRPAVSGKSCATV